MMPHTEKQLEETDPPEWIKVRFCQVRSFVSSRRDGLFILDLKFLQARGVREYRSHGWRVPRVGCGDFIAAGAVSPKALDGRRDDMVIMRELSEQRRRPHASPRLTPPNGLSGGVVAATIVASA